jgi:hypothetical protein
VDAAVDSEALPPQLAGVMDKLVAFVAKNGVKFEVRPADHHQQHHYQQQQQHALLHLLLYLVHCIGYGLLPGMPGISNSSLCISNGL